MNSFSSRIRAALCFVIIAGLIAKVGTVYADLSASAKKRPAGFAVMENARLRVTIDTCVAWPTFGMMMSLFDKESRTTIGNTQLFRLHAGSVNAFTKSTLRCSADTIVLAYSGFGLTKLTALAEYALTESAIVLQLKIFSKERTAFPEGLHLDLQTDLGHLTCSNHFSNIINWNLDTVKGALVDFNQIIQFSDSASCLTLLVRNPFHSHFGFNTNGKKKHSFFILQCVSPLTEQVGTPNAFSTIDANDTIVRRIEVYPYNSVDAPVFFGEHPEGFSNTMTMYWDELPNRDNWAFMTTDTATDTKYYRYFVRLLKEDPAIKMGFVLLPDRLVIPPSTAFRNWTVSNPYVIADTIEESEGAACAALVSDAVDILLACQTIPCKPNTAYTLSYNVKTKGVFGFGAIGDVSADTHVINMGTPLRGDNPWQQYGFDFKTSDNDTALSVNMCLIDAYGSAFFDDVRLTPFCSDTNLLQNGGFEAFVPGVIFDNPRRLWSNAHGPERIVTEAPQSYLRFLQRVENHTLRYGWEDRVEIGCHGYHHTPSFFEPDPKHEFEYYDPIGDGLRIGCIFSEYRQMGLTKASLRFWRSPGFKYTKSLLDLLVDSGFVFFDAPPIGEPAFGASMLQRGKNRMWLVKNGWWADYGMEKGDPTDHLFSILTQGHLAVIGGHPEAIFWGASEASYQRFKGMMAAFKAACPAMGFVFPDEYSDNADAIYKLRIESVERKGVNIVFRLRGYSKAGNTVVYLGKCDRVSFNGIAIGFTVIKGVTYAVLPSDSSGVGTVVFENAANNAFAALVHPQNNGNRVLIGNMALGSHVAVFTLLGRRVCLIQNTTHREALNRLRNGSPRLQSGVYIVKSMTPGGKGHDELFILPR